MELIQVICFVLTVAVLADCRPHEIVRRQSDNVQPAGGVTRTRLLLDLLSAGTGTLKLLQDWSRVASEVVDVGQDTFNQNTDEIVKHSHKLIDANKEAAGDAVKSLSNVGGQFAKSAGAVLTSFPRFAIETAQTLLPSAS